MHRGKKGEEPGRMGYRIFFHFFSFASQPLLSPPRTRILIFRNSSRDGRTERAKRIGRRNGDREESRRGKKREPPTAALGRASERASREDILDMQASLFAGMHREGNALFVKSILSKFRRETLRISCRPSRATFVCVCD